MIKTAKMSIRNSITDYPYISSINEFIGSCSPLKFFMSPRGYALQAVVCPKTGVRFTTVQNPTVTGDRFTSTLTGTWDIDTEGTLLSDAITGDVLLVAAGRPRDTTTDILECEFGSNVGNRIQLRANAAGSVTSIFAAASVTDTSSANLTCGLPTVDTVLAAGIIKAGIPGTYLHSNTGSATVSSVATATTNTAAATLDLSAASITIQSSQFAALGLFAFANGLPSNWKALAQWMGYEWLNGNFVFPANWDGA